MKDFKVWFSQLFVITILLFIIGCSVPPPRSAVEETIVKYLEEKGYKVSEIIIGNIRPTPPGEKQYMGTEGYTVHVSSLTLEFTRDIGEPWNYKRGWHITFDNASVRIKKSTAQKDKWVITDISGIPLL